MHTFSRRSFLGAAAGVMVAPRFAFGANEKLTLGFIGMGTKGREHLGGFLNKKEVEVLAVCDVEKTRLDTAKEMVNKKYAERVKSGAFAGCQAFNDFRELLKVPGLDAVVISTPDHWHAINSVLAARAGKHIYCEKPLTQNIADGRWLVNEVTKAKVIFQVGSQQRSEFSNRFRTAVEAIWNGRIGTVKTIRIGVAGPAKPCDLPTQELPPNTDWDNWLGPAPERGYNEVLCPKGNHRHFPQWRAYSEYAGGGMADMGAHHFDIAQWALHMDGSGPVTIQPPTDEKQLKQGAGMVFTYANGVTMIHNQFIGEEKADCVFEGTSGKILVGRGELKASNVAIIKDPFTAKDQRVVASNDHKQNWLDAVRAKAQTICPAEIGHRTATICHLGNIGYRLGRKLTWDPVKETFANDAEASGMLSREPRAKWKV